MISFFQKVIDVLNENRIPYMLSGSVAMSVYTLPRATRDFDFVVYMHKKQILSFAEQFKEGYYCDIDSVTEAIKHNSMFNIISFESNYKADFILMKEDDYGIEAFNRRNEMDFYGRTFFTITEEDLLISKLKWIQDIQTPQQMEDIKKISQLDSLDWVYINKWLQKLELQTFNLF